MASPKAPTVVAPLTLPPMADPLTVQEVFANDVVIQVRHDAVQLTFCSIQAADSDEKGQVTDKRLVRARVALPAPVFRAMLQVAQQLGTALQQHQMLAGLAPSTKN
jgi:hypothetical protein